MTAQQIHDRQKALVLAAERCVRHPDTYAVRKVRPVPVQQGGRR